jgi:hypothetical protein
MVASNGTTRIAEVLTGNFDATSLSYFRYQYWQASYLLLGRDYLVSDHWHVYKSTKIDTDKGPESSLI